MTVPGKLSHNQKYLSNLEIYTDTTAAARFTSYMFSSNK